jgi:hypothetical protein
VDDDDPYIRFNKFSYSNDLIDKREQLDVVLKMKQKVKGKAKGK